MSGKSGGLPKKRTLWKYYEKLNSDSAKCTICQNCISTKGRTTKGLSVHLKTIHKIDLDAEQPEQPQAQQAAQSAASMRPAQIECSASCSRLCDPIDPKKRKITDFFEKENTMEQMVSRMVAKDGIALSTFCTSKDLR
uniref:BED-type domain-containing protein n=1 Tax=Cacopsylla melanoneura TaxID=428564 RepID=A0A8D8TPQ5_9HEMI